MARDLFGVNPLSEPILDFVVGWITSNQFQWNLYQNEPFACKKIVYKCHMQSDHHVVLGLMC